MSNEPVEESETTITSEPDALPKKDKKGNVDELNEDELKKISGGVSPPPPPSGPLPIPYPNILTNR
jgi:bacteriocin-like protein